MPRIDFSLGLVSLQSGDQRSGLSWFLRSDSNEVAQMCDGKTIEAQLRYCTKRYLVDPCLA